MSEALLIFTIGPVQSYIAQARKTQDLYAGSFILSHLCRTAAGYARKKYNARIIFPALEEGAGNNQSLPNRFLAVLSFSGPGELKTAGSELEGLVRDELYQLAVNVVKKYAGNAPAPFERQVVDSLQVSWVARPLDREHYGRAYRELESWLGAVKNVRLFNQFSEEGRKCSVTGEHNALFFRGKRPPAYLAPEAVRLDGRVSLKYLGAGESLGAAAFVKRCAGRYFKEKNIAYDDRFPSTARIALMDTLNKLPQDMVCEYEHLFGDDFDSQLYYEENLTRNYFEKYSYPTEKLEPARALLKKIYQEAGRLRLRFGKYYAVLMLDGDGMGEWLGGKHLADETSLFTFHTGLTSCLSQYAGKVRSIIQEPKPKGRAVYCGGDDVLALVNLRYLLPVLRDLRRHFPSFAGIAPVKGEKDSSASCGVCIAHYKTPLSVVLNWARQMEKEAKRVEGKDALALAAVKHSGEVHKTSFKWRSRGLDGPGLLQELVGLLKVEKLSDTFIRKLQPEFWRLMTPEGDFADLPLLQIELERLLARSCNDTAAFEGKELKELTGRLSAQLKDFCQSSDLKNLMSFLDIAAFLAREVI